MTDIKYDFNNILIVPTVTTDIESRYSDIVLPDMLPLFTAPMDTVVNSNNFDTYLNNRINVTLPRTIKNSLFQSTTRFKHIEEYSKVFIGLGFQDIDFHHKTNFNRFYEGQHILIDVANGHMEKIVEYARKIKSHRPDIILMVGNIANPETYRWYVKNNCVDFIRVGIGNGGGCLTTKQSGVGYPVASLIEETYKVKQLCAKEFPKTKLPAIVADGGMKDYVDIIKALALGADYVMIGSMFNKALESCGGNYVFRIPVSQKVASYCFDRKIPVMSHFRGMSTKSAQKSMGKTSFKTSEGITKFQRVEYRLSGWVENFEHYLRNAMSYSNAKTLNDFIGKADIRQITKEAYDRFNK